VRLHIIHSVVAASPASCCHAQTLNSFRFAERARQVENSPRVNFVSSVPSGGSTTTTSSALYSIMSAFEIKKDISRLSRLIRSAQSVSFSLRTLFSSNTLLPFIETIEFCTLIACSLLSLVCLLGNYKVTTGLIYSPYLYEFFFVSRIL